MKTIATYENNGLCSKVIQEKQNLYVVVFDNFRFSFNNSYNAFLKARQIVGKPNCGYKFKE